MRAPGPVQHPVACRGFRFAARHGLLGLACLAVLLWAASFIVSPFQAWFGWLATLGAVLAFAMGARRGAVRHASGPVTQLVWDGLAWSLRGPNPGEGRPVCALDLGPWLLLRWQAASPVPDSPRWLPLAAADQVDSWHRLRVALHATPRAAPHVTPGREAVPRVATPIRAAH